MLNYLVFGIAIIIFATVLIISGKAISRGIEARQNMKEKSDNENAVLNSVEEEKSYIANDNNLSNQISDLNKLKEKGIITEEEFKKAKDKILN